MTKVQPLLLHQDLEALQCSEVGVQQELWEWHQLRCPVPPVTAVHYYSSPFSLQLIHVSDISFTKCNIHSGFALQLYSIKRDKGLLYPNRKWMGNFFHISKNRTAICYKVKSGRICWMLTNKKLFHNKTFFRILLTTKTFLQLEFSTLNFEDVPSTIYYIISYFELDTTKIVLWNLIQ